MTAPDIRAGDFVRVFADSGALRRGTALRHSLILEVLAVADPPGRPDWRYVSGRICRRDLTHAERIQHTAVEVTGRERGLFDLAGQWQLLRRPDSGSLGEQPHDPSSCGHRGRSHLGPCIDDRPR